MAIWTESARVIAKDTLGLSVGVGQILESAACSAVASLSLTDTSTIYIESANVNAVNSVMVNEAYGEIAVGTITGFLPIVSGVLIPFEPAGIVTNPLPVVAGIGSTEKIGVGIVQPAIATLTATMVTGVICAGTVEAALGIVAGVVAPDAAVQPKLAIVTASGFAGKVGKGAVIAALPQVTADCINQAVWGGNILPTAATVAAAAETGNIGTADLISRVGLVTVVGQSGVVGQAAITLPTRLVEGISYQDQLITGEVIMLPPIVQGVSVSVANSFLAWVLNTENGRVSNYTEFPFIALGQIGDTPAGAAADGIYLLEGSDDAGQPIDAVMRFGMADFGGNDLIRINDIYVGGVLENDMELSIRSDGEVTEYTYPLVEREEHIPGHRAKLGKGFRSRYRQVSITNIAGADFTIDNIELPQKITQ